MAHYQPAPRPDTRVIPYVDPAQPATVQLYTAQDLAARRAQDRILYARWLARQAQFAEHDRKVRRLMFRISAVAAVVLAGGVGLLAWAAWQAIASIGAGLLLVPLALLALAGLVFGGHRCITIVEHRH
jgi:hypothetical protein